MKSFGTWLIILSVGSAILPYFGLQFILLSWVDSWGPMIGWVIRGAFVLLGIAMIAADRRK